VHQTAGVIPAISKRPHLDEDEKAVFDLLGDHIAGQLDFNEL
jgi:hypothetical protein